jgi:hypothetical protein
VTDDREWWVPLAKKARADWLAAINDDVMGVDDLLLSCRWQVYLDLVAMTPQEKVVWFEQSIMAEVNKGFEDEVYDDEQSE